MGEEVILWINSAPLEIRFIVGYALAFLAGMLIAHFIHGVADATRYPPAIEPLDYNLARQKQATKPDQSPNRSSRTKS